MQGEQEEQEVPVVAELLVSLDVSRSGVGRVDDRDVVLVGQPIAVGVTLANRTIGSDGSSVDMRLPSDRGTWTQWLSVKFVALDDVGGPKYETVWLGDSTMQKFSRRGGVGSVRAVPQGRPVSAMYVIPPSVSEKLTEGTYVVDASFDTRESAQGGAWAGVLSARSKPIVARAAKGQGELAGLLLARGDFYRESGDLDGAMGEYSKLAGIMREYRDHLVLFRMGLVFSDEKRWAEARSAFEEYLVHAGGRRDHLVDLARRRLKALKGRTAADPAPDVEGDR